MRSAKQTWRRIRGAESTQRKMPRAINSQMCGSSPDVAASYKPVSVTTSCFSVAAITLAHGGCLSADVVVADLMFGPPAGDNVGQERPRTARWYGAPHVDDFPDCRVERDEKAQRFVALVFEAATPRSPK